MRKLLCTVLLLLYPRSFREEYGGEWMELAGRRGLWAVAADSFRMIPGLWLGRDRVRRSPRRGSGSMADTFYQDVRFSLRTLRKRPLFTLMAVGTMSLGIGSATAIFSVVEGVLLRGLPFENPEELVSVWQTSPEWREHPELADMWNWGYLSHPGYERWRDGQTQLEDVAIHGSTARYLTSPGEVERISVGVASPSLLPVLGVEPLLGRGFLPEEGNVGTAPVAILSYGFWQERFGGDVGVLGRTIGLNEGPFEVVGVLPRDFELRGLGFFGSGGAKPVWIPTGADGYRRSDNSHSYEAIGRLGPGAGLPLVAAEARPLIRAADEEPGHSVRVESWLELQQAGLWSPLLLLLGASLILLLIATGNVAVLLMGESAGRHHEMATRTALGASRSRLIRQLLTESMLLGLGGSLFGIAVAFAGTRLLLSFAPALPRLDQVSVNGAVLLFAIALGLLTGLFFGLAPSLQLAVGRARQTLGSGWRTGSRDRSGFQQALIGAELALTVVLLVSGALLVRSLDQLLAVDPGFQADQLAMARVSLPRYRYGDGRDRGMQVERIREALASVPGVTLASGTTSLPFYSSANALSYGIEGRPEPEGASPHASLKEVLPDYFETMGIRIVEGRPILESDGMDGVPVAVISENFARRHWPDQSPIGARILFGDTLLVVGVAADVVHESLAADPMVTLYRPFLREPGTTINFLVRTTGNPEALLGSLRQAIRLVDSEIPITSTLTVSSLITASAKNDRFRATLMAAFAICAALLAGAGVFGITARTVAQRRKELGIRKALGARPGSLVQTSLIGAAKAGGLGVAVGLVITFFSSGLLRDFLFQIHPWDPMTYGVVGASLMATTVVAAWIPARRASRVDPMEVLREE
jgi:putative ABC transport system permease protein